MPDEPQELGAVDWISYRYYEINDCGECKEEKILDTFTDRYKLRKVDYHGVIDV